MRGLATTELLLITGAAGVGKSTASYEVGEELRRRNLPHAIIDSDELDRVWPLPYDDERRRPIDIANLSSWWSQFAELGIPRLVMSGVFIDLDDARGWIAEAIPDAAIRAVRLVASAHELDRRVERRELGSAATDQLRRSRAQARAIAATTHPNATVIEVDGLSVTELGVVLCDLMAWDALIPKGDDR